MVLNNIYAVVIIHVFIFFCMDLKREEKLKLHACWMNSWISLCGILLIFIYLLHQGQQPSIVRDLHTACLYWVHNHRDLFRGELTEHAFLQINSDDQQNAFRRNVLGSEFSEAKDDFLFIFQCQDDIEFFFFFILCWWTRLEGQSHIPQSAIAVDEGVREGGKEWRMEWINK